MLPSQCCPEAVVPRQDERSVERLTSRYGPFGNGDQRVALRPYRITPEAVATPHHAPPVVRAPRGPSSKSTVSQVNPVAGRSSRRSLSGAMQALQLPKRRGLIRHASVLPHTVYRASLQGITTVMVW